MNRETGLPIGCRVGSTESWVPFFAHAPELHYDSYMNSKRRLDCRLGSFFRHVNSHHSMNGLIEFDGIGGYGWECVGLESSQTGRVYLRRRLVLRASPDGRFGEYVCATESCTHVDFHDPARTDGCTPEALGQTTPPPLYLSVRPARHRLVREFASTALRTHVDRSAWLSTLMAALVVLVLRRNVGPLRGTSAVVPAPVAPYRQARLAFDLPSALVRQHSRWLIAVLVLHVAVTAALIRLLPP
jgi:hypothetical protein